MPTKTIDPVSLLKDDHKAVKALFDTFEQAKSDPPKKKAARKALIELKVHAAIEEEIFYPAFDKQLKNEEAHDIMLEAEEEHHVVHVLIAELDKMPDDHEHFDAKFTVLAENVRHHIKEEETEMLPKAAKMPAELLGRLGEQMDRRKREMEGQLTAAAR